MSKSQIIIVQLKSKIFNIYKYILPDKICISELFVISLYHNTTILDFKLKGDGIWNGMVVWESNGETRIVAWLYIIRIYVL